jgi:osmotically-inducible protein OsmY
MKKASLLFTVGIALLLTPGTMTAQAESAAKDNTAVNKRDRNKGAVTADQQKENRSDREISAEIRRAVMDDKELSTYAHNVKIVTRNGRVTLKGPVRSDAEKQAIEAKASEVAGAGKISNSISVKPKS